MKTLEALSKIEEQSLIEKQRELQHAEQQYEHLQQRYEDLQQQMIVEINNLQKNPENMQFFDQYNKWAKQEKQRLDEEIEAKTAAIKVLRDLLHDAFANKKKFDILIQRRHEALQKHITQKEHSINDELAGQNWLKNAKTHKLKNI